MKIVQDFIGNYALVCAGVAWVAAQIVKIFTGVFKTRKFSIVEMLFGNGGMPSSHSAAVCAMATACALRYGFGSGYFAIAFLLCLIVIRDATGVRLETGKQARAINHLMRSHHRTQHTQTEGEHETLKEFVGHTPLQVFVGAVVGVVVPFLMALIPAYAQYLPHL